MKFITMIIILAMSYTTFSADIHMTENDLRQSLKNKDVPDQQITEIIEALIGKFGSNENQNFPISGYLYSHGFSTAILFDSDLWSFDATYIDSNGSIVDIDNMYVGYYKNGGIKLEAVYKWIFLFLPSGTNVENLHGAIFGGTLNGISLNVDAFVGFEGGVLFSNNRRGTAFVLSPRIGIGGGISFPKIEFCLSTQPCEASNTIWRKVLP